MPARRCWPAAVGVVAAGLLLASCTSSGPPAVEAATASNVGGLATITVLTGPDRRFHPNTITVHPGLVRLVLKNRVQHVAGEPHNLTFDTFRAGTLPLIRPGQQTSTTFTAPAPGKYQFVCTIHAGQTGVMVVTK
jgi:plastocyanin